MPDTGQPLSELLAQGDIKTLKQVNDNGRDSVYVDVRDANGWKYEIWIDPGTNYLARKLIRHRRLPNGQNSRIEGEVLSFREVKPGVFFPDRVGQALFFGGDWFQKGKASLSNLQVNEAVAAGQFRHVFPVGTLVADVEKGTTYTIGPAGTPIHVAPIASPPPSGPPAGPVGTATPPDADKDRWSWRHLLLLSSGLVLAAGLIMMFWKRRQRTAA